MIDQTSFYNDVIHTYRQLTNRANRVLEKYDLSSSYWRVIRIVERADGKKFGDITAELQIEKPALTKLIKKLVELNYVTVQRGEDRREKVILLTVEGRERIQIIRQELEPLLASGLVDIDEQQLLLVQDVLKSIQHNLKEQ